MYNYINYFLSRGDDVTVVTSKIDPNVELPENVVIRRVNLSRWPRIIRPLLFNKEVKKILLHTSFDLELGLERVSSNLLIAPNTHAGYIHHQGKKYRTASDYFQLKMDRTSFKAARIIFACSEMVKKEIKQYYKIENNKIQVLNPPLDINRFRPSLLEKPELRKKLDLPLDKKLFLFVSTSHKRKGLDLLLKVFSKLSDQYLLLVAGSEITDKPNVRGLGFKENLENYYQVVDYTLHPAVYEPFGQIVSESIACGTPVMISDRVGAKEVVGEEFGIIIDSLDPDDWLNAIESAQLSGILDSEKFREKMSLEEHMNFILKHYQNARDSVLNSDVK